MQLNQILDFLMEPNHQAQQYLLQSDLNVLFINPEATGANFYKIFVPFWVLKKAQPLSTAITGWTKFNPVKRFKNDSKTPIRSRQIVWADTIVIPFTNQPLKDFMEASRIVNPNTRILFHVDFDFIDIPEDHPLKEAFDTDSINNVIQNIMSCDTTVVSNPKLASHLITRLKELGHEADRDNFAVQLLCVDEETMLDGVQQPKSKDPDHFNLLVLANDNQISDMETISKALIKAKEKHGNYLKIIYFGANKNKPRFERAVKGLQYIPEGAVPVWKYYEKLAKINPNAVIIPSDRTEWSIRSTDYKRFLDCSLLKIPVLTPKVHPMDVLIENGQNGLFYESDNELLQHIDSLIGDRKLGASIGDAAYNFVENNFSYNRDKMQRIINLIG